MYPIEVLKEFDQYLIGRGLTLEAIVIGGAALSLMRIVSRETKDCDILDPDLTPEIAEAAKSFAREIGKRGGLIREDWLNNGPVLLKKTLPEKWENRLQMVFSGEAIVLHTLGRCDLLKSKLDALCSRGTDIDDCIALKPSSDELREAIGWVQEQDSNLDWPAHVQATFEDLARRLGHAN